MPDIAIFCLVLTAIFAYLNHRYVKLPTTIGVMGIALLLSLGLVGLNALGFSGLHDRVSIMVQAIDFSDVLMQGMLSVLLFAGALHVDLSELRAYRWQVGLLAVLGTMISTVLVGFGLWYVLPLTGVALPLPYCLVFGALISPTDPIAVMGLLKSAGAPRSLEIVITGESLFNDGVGVVLFALLFSLVSSGHTPTLAEGALRLAREAGGGIVFGLVLGYVVYHMLKSIDSYEEEVLITLAAVLGGYELASRLHVSGPLAMVVVGLIIGNHGRAFAMSDTTRQHVDTFWHLLDGILNSVLFVLIGLEVILFSMTASFMWAIAAVIAVTLVARLLSVGGLLGVARPLFRLPEGSWQVLTWGGLRGGISVALALSLPLSPQRDIVLTLTYAVVVFSILFQGLSIGTLVRKVTSRV
jgi:monovalent cation:H+ antiporter, CPA1 family